MKANFAGVEFNRILTPNTSLLGTESSPEHFETTFLFEAIPQLYLKIVKKRMAGKLCDIDDQINNF